MLCYVLFVVCCVLFVVRCVLLVAYRCLCAGCCLLVGGGLGGFLSMCVMCHLVFVIVYCLCVCCVLFVCVVPCLMFVGCRCLLVVC